MEKHDKTPLWGVRQLVGGSGNQKKASLTRGQRPWASVIIPGSDDISAASLARRLIFSKSNRKPRKAIAF